jgi:hypothetical protein
MNSTDVLLSTSCHTPGFGVSGAGEPLLTPTDTARTPAAANSGTMPRVMPGTSRSDTTDGTSTPSSDASSLAIASWLIAVMEFKQFSNSVLNGEAWNTTSPVCKPTSTPTPTPTHPRPRPHTHAHAHTPKSTPTC